ncbi:Hsp20/alpha crystallin family protein [Thermanaeromonas sp. C210]|uniref:Hsp20/alpha crystallin family protein n=1 Tax=Thermanaeromonas sp. C210 TaxID=2731925 RepID=UPI00155B688E|nr:Hsp20/alpha crystallin family protein [Thermanaeromonas sp. C210]GFN23091.1 heat-shock protein Hsp20 [Thermanaeromonas sp. C210]
MEITPWRPWRQRSPWPLRELVAWPEEVMRNWFGGWAGNLWETGPRLDLYQTDKEVVVTAELPGLVSKDDVEITATENSLSIRGEVRRTQEAAEQDYHRSERFYGTFARTISLPAEVDPERATASYRNGILEIRIPKAAQQRQRRIPIDLH